MEPSDRPHAFPDVVDTPGFVDMGEPFTVLIVLCHKDDLVHCRPEGVDQPLDEGLSEIPEEILLHAVHPPGFPSDKDDC